MGRHEYHEVRVGEVARVVEAMGLSGFQRLADSLPPLDVKYGEMTLGQGEALGNAVGCHREDLLSGKVTLAPGNAETTVQLLPTNRSLFDRRGNRIFDLRRSRSSAKAEPDRNRWNLEQPTFDFTELETTIRQYCPSGLDFPSAAMLKERGEATIKWLRQEERLANLLKGPHFILGFPKMPVTTYKQALDEVFVPALREAFKTHFADRQFEPHLIRDVRVVSESRNQLHFTLPNDVVVGVWFPLCLFGFSTDLAREQMASLPYPERIWLGGAFEGAMAATCYMETIGCQGGSLVLDCSANSCGFGGDGEMSSLDIQSFKDKMYFVARYSGPDCVWKGQDNMSSSLFVLAA